MPQKSHVDISVLVFKNNKCAHLINSSPSLSGGGGFLSELTLFISSSTPAASPLILTTASRPLRGAEERKSRKKEKRQTGEFTQMWRSHGERRYLGADSLSPPPHLPALPHPNTNTTDSPRQPPRPIPLALDCVCGGPAVYIPGKFFTPGHGKPQSFHTRTSSLSHSGTHANNKATAKRQQSVQREV